ncbi:MAG: class I SAM-dependent methyltransferase [Bryobacterales bacterium]|nr:class I SAM-dependent methyltransferase [Bryobacterales bacterium]
MNAFRYLRRNLPHGARVFEWSSGTSTIWFERHCAEVVSVEDNEEWYRFVAQRVSKARLSCREGEQYVQAIAEFPERYFDLISIDGSHRLACYQLALRHLKPGGILLIDNTDKDQLTRGEMWQLDSQIGQNSEFEVLRFPGWIHGTWAPIETTICLHRDKKQHR